MERIGRGQKLTIERTRWVGGLRIVVENYGECSSLFAGNRVVANGVFATTRTPRLRP